MRLTIDQTFAAMAIPLSLIAGLALFAPLQFGRLMVGKDVGIKKWKLVFIRTSASLVIIGSIFLWTRFLTSR